MLWHCDVLSEDRYQSPKFLGCLTNPGAVMPDELLRFMATPGFLPLHFRLFFGWNRGRTSQIVQTSRAEREHFAADGRQNAGSITVSDGIALAVLLLKGKETSRPILPYWSIVSIRELGLKEASRVLEVPYQRVRTWASSDLWGLGGSWEGGKFLGWGQERQFSVDGPVSG